MKAVFAILAVVCLATAVQGHARLTTPQPWNTNPSKTSPCGGGTAPAKAVATYQKGTTVNINWNVIAGDGTGALTAKLDPNGGTSFTTDVTLTGTAPASTGSFSFQMAVPDIECTACTLQIYSSSQWFSCATIAISATAPAPTQGPPPPCVTLTGMTFCSDLNGKQVNGNTNGQSAVEVDRNLQATYTSYLANTNVFSYGTNADCMAAYKKFLCADAFTPCGSAVTSACQNKCTTSNTLCGLTQSHINLYSCDIYANTTRDSFGTCSGASNVGFTAAVLLVASFLVTFLAL